MPDFGEATRHTELGPIAAEEPTAQGSCRLGGLVGERGGREQKDFSKHLLNLRLFTAWSGEDFMLHIVHCRWKTHHYFLGQFMFITHIAADIEEAYATKRTFYWT